MEYFALFFSAIFINNIVLTKFLGICPFIGISKKKSQAFSMGIAVTLVVLISSILTYFLYKYILVPIELEYLNIILFILLIASIVQILEIVIKRFFPIIYKQFGIYLPLITTNCLVLGVVLNNVTMIEIENSYNLLNVVTYSLGVSFGYLMAIYIFSNIRERLEKAPIISYFKGVPIALITAAIMAMAFTAFTGVL